MTKPVVQVEEIKSAIALLPQSESVDLGEWFREFEAQIWNVQIDEDVKAGRVG